MLLLLALALAGTTHLWLSALNEPGAPGLTRPLPEWPAAVSVAPTRLAESAVVVVVDGLRWDTSLTLPFVNELRGAGFNGFARAELPTHSRPNYTVLLTGTSPERHGIRNNRGAFAPLADTLLTRVHEASGRTALATDLDWWHSNFGKEIDAWHLAEDPTLENLTEAFENALDTRAKLTLLHAVQLDFTAHRKGVGPDYGRVARKLDSVLAEVLPKRDANAEVVVVTADHGHRARGGHGGPEPEVRKVPLVLAGHGVRRAALPHDLGSLGGLAPTLAVLLGTEFPRDASLPIYESVLDADTLGRDYVAARLAEYAERRRRYERAWLEHQGVEARDLERLGLDRLMELRGKTVERMNARRLWPGRLAAALLVLALAWCCHRLTAGGRAWLGLPVYGAAASALAMFVAEVPSASAAVRASQHFLWLLLCAVVALVLHVIAASWSSQSNRQGYASTLPLLLRDALIYAALGPLVWLTFGFEHPLCLPHPSLLYLPLLLAFFGGVFAGSLGVLLFVTGLSRRPYRSLVKRWEP